MIEISEEVKSKIVEILAKYPGKHVRVVISGDGCAGPYFGVTLDEADSDEETITVNGIDLLISEQVKRYADVTRINLFINSSGQDL
jgi:Fe-S cluster assembly iron-binding protein IscA